MSDPHSATLAAEPPIEAPTIVEDPAPEVSTAEQKRDTAWRTGDQFQWHGEKLSAFAIDREGDWRMHRAALGLPELGRVMSEAFLSDAIRIVWFCRHEPRDWLGLLGDAERLELKIREWASRNVHPGEQGDITTLAISIFNSAYTNRATARDSGDAPGE